jgi:hypothetical protein
VVEFVINDVEVIDTDVIVTLVVGGSVAIGRRKSSSSENEYLI